MTGLVAYILSKKIALSAVSGLKNMTLSPTGQLIFEFNNGTSSSWQIPLPKDGVDGLSITKVEIDKNKHLICTMSDESTIDAGEIPGGTSEGLVQVNNLASLPTQGKEDTLYLTLNDDTLYYWNNIDKIYRPISGGTGANSIDFKTSTIEFDGAQTIFDLPIDNKKISIFVNGMYLTENEDYTIDRTVSPNTITFLEIWESTDLCTVVWAYGTVNENSSSTIYYRDFSTTTKKQLELFAAINLENLPNKTIDTSGPVLVDATNVYNILTQSDYPKDKQPYIKTVYVLDSNKILGIALASYKSDANKFELYITTFNSISLATKEDINELFQGNETTGPDASNLATKQDIDNLFN